MSIIRRIIEAIFGSEPMSSVDLALLLDERARHASQPLQWRTSIVDFLKLLDIDSSFDARKQLALELGDTGGYKGTAEENIWLHKQVFRKLAENGGKVPSDLL